MACPTRIVLAFFLAKQFAKIFRHCADNFISFPPWYRIADPHIEQYWYGISTTAKVSHGGTK
jgi:hypothetical protein